MDFLNVFASVDQDNDLVIHESDLDDYAAKMKYEKAFTKKWLRLFDLDKDGKITFTEFCETLGLDEKIYEEKLREVRKNLAMRQQQQQQQATSDVERANRRVSRLPRPPPTQPPVEQELKENIAPQRSRTLKTAPQVQEAVDNEVDEDSVKPQAVKTVRTGIPEQSEGGKSLEEIRLEFDEDDPKSIEVEFTDMETKDLDSVKELLAKMGSQSRKTSESSAEFDRRMMHELDKKMGNTWQCQSNPELSHKDVNYTEGSMAVLVAKPQKRVMVWRPQKSGGMCCCC